MTFLRSPLLRLTSGYVLIIMVISVGFSGVIYRLTATQVRNSLPPPSRYDDFFGARFNLSGDNLGIADYFEQQYQSVMSHLRLTLLLLNVGVLIGAGVTSYFLARRTLRPIEQALEDQRRFTADASHELRTPLAAMKTEIEVGLHANDPNEHGQILKSNLEEIGKLEKLSTSLLHLAQHEDERQVLVRKPLEMKGVIDEAMQRVEPMAKKKKITMKANDTVGEITGDQASLTELFVILLDNAIKYSPHDAAVKIVGTWTPTKVSLVVVDQGIGIPLADQPLIFRRFYRADPSRSKNKTNGHGLGLAIAQKIVDRHQGSITVASEVGKGSTFTVVLPRN